MKDIPKFALILFMVMTISTGALSWINQLTLPKRIEQQKKALNEGLTIVLPGSNPETITMNKDSNSTYYLGYHSKDTTQLIGFAYIAEAKGYQSTIKTLVGIDTSGIILGIKILSQMETPGLGSRCEEVRSVESIPWWQAQFYNKKVNQLSVDKDGGNIESITGATITSRVITNSISQTGQTIFNKFIKP